MGFTVYYRSTRPISGKRADAIRQAATTLNEGRTWLSCEPVDFFMDQEDGRLWGGSKPNFQPHPDDVAAAALEALPDGTVRDLLEILCELSRDHDVDWEFSHDHDPRPIGFIRGGICEDKLLEQVEAFGDLADMLQDVMGEGDTGLGRFPFSSTGPDEADPDDRDNDDDGPSILPLWPKGR
jgi:hypothetical protein